MNQEKIGKFISLKRKEKNMTKEELGERLGVSDRTVGNWENGRNMPDLSLFKPLCNELDISINELLSGEELNEKEYQKRLEENIINTINYDKERNHKKQKNISVLLIILGIIISFCSMFVFKDEHIMCFVSLVVGGLLYFLGILGIFRDVKNIYKVLFSFLLVSSFWSLLFYIDYLCVLNMHQVPRFTYSKTVHDNMILYETFFYNVYRINPDTVNEYYIVDTDNQYTVDTVVYSPFDREKSGIDSIIKYRKYDVNVLDNTKGLLEHLPLSEYEFAFSIDKDNLGLIVNYDAKDWNVYVSNYLKKSLIYNSVSIFALITNVEYIDFNVSLPYENVSFHIKRDYVENLYPEYKYIVQNNIDVYNFNRFLEEQINNYEFVMYNFKQLFIDSNLKNSKKIDVIIEKEKIVNNESVFEPVVLKSIEDKNELNSLIEIFLHYNSMPENSAVTSEGNAWTLVFKDENDKVICTFYVWYNGWFGTNGKEYCVANRDVLINLLK